MVSRIDINQWLDRIEPIRRGDKINTKNYCKHTHCHSRRELKGHPLSPPASSSYASERRTPSRSSAGPSSRSKPEPDQDQDQDLQARLKRRRRRSCLQSMYLSSSSLRTPNNKRRRLQAAAVPERDADEDDHHHHQQTGLSHGAHDDDGDEDEAEPLGQEQDPDQCGDDGNQVETPRPVWTARRSGNISTNPTSLHLDAGPFSSPTKRPRRKHTPNSFSSASASGLVEDSDAGDSTSNTSRQSGASSPIKKMAAMELSPDGLETRPFSLDDPRMPQSLADLLVEMEAYGNGEQVLPWSQKVNFPLTRPRPSTVAVTVAAFTSVLIRWAWGLLAERDRTSGKDRPTLLGLSKLHVCRPCRCPEPRS